MSLKSWLFRVVHNLAIDQLRARAHRRHEPIDAAEGIADSDDVEEAIAQRQAAALALEQFLLLSVQQRSVLALKDVLGYTMQEIAELLQLSLGATKATLHRARGRAAELAAEPRTPARGEAPSPELRRYIHLFNSRDWTGLTELLAEEVRLTQTARGSATGKHSVATSFFRGYAATEGWRMVPAFTEGREAIAVFDPAEAMVPAYLMLVDWSEGLVSGIRDFRYARYIVDGAAITIGTSA